MGYVLFVGVLLFVGVFCEDAKWDESNAVKTSEDDILAGSKIVLAFVTFRHGDRTPDQEELDLYPAEEKLSKDIFFPYGMKSLTNKGKLRGFAVGKYLRKQYDGLVSNLYLDDEIDVRTTHYSRTQMTALTALAALYPPPPAQMWNPNLNWQPVPYNTPDLEEDDLMYYYNCPRYIQLRDAVYYEPEFQEKLKPYQSLYVYLQNKTGNNITSPEQVFYLDNLFQTLRNVGVKTPNWACDVMPQIKEVTKIEYAAEFYTPEMIRLCAGVQMSEILNATNAYILGDVEQPKLRLYSAHENNVAALMAASLVFEPHQPSYGATFSLELRKMGDDQYAVTAVYARNAGGPAKYLAIKGCDSILCDYTKFVSLVKDFAWTKQDFYEHCRTDYNEST